MIRLLRESDYRRMPWKNGLGVTVEIAREPGERDFEWRVSVADVVTDGAFSRFDGVDRVIVTIEGEGMALTHNGGDAVTLRVFQPHAFRGEDETHCQLVAGPVRDFNLMTRRGVAFGSLRVIEADAEIVGRMLYCARGSARVKSGVNEYQLAERETLLADASAHFAVGCDDDAKLIAVLVV